MATGIFVSYLRCSTVRQGVSGLGLDAQRETIRTFLNGGEWTLAAEYVEVESGRSDTRPELAKALARCRVLGATLIVANVSRLTRSVAFLSKLLESKVEVRFCDLPKIEGPAGRFMLVQMAAVAELEAGMISDRTRKALAAAKARGQKLGGARANSANLHEVGTAVSSAVRSARANSHAIDLAQHIAEAKAEGATTLQAIADKMNAAGIPTARGGKWSPVQVSRVLDRIPAPVEPVPYQPKVVRRRIVEPSP